MKLLLIIWAAAALYLIFHYVYFHSRLALYKDKTLKTFDEAVSIVICARNEAENLCKNLPGILAQRNCIFEVVVVNDRSTDATGDVLKKFKGQYPNLHIVENREDMHYTGKKKALLLGLQKARHPYFLLTDADCSPRSDQWLSKMSGHFHQREIVLGFSPHTFTGTFTAKVVQWETLLTAQNYLTFALAGMPYMGVGRNLAYSRKVFESSDKFQSHLHLPSGDDDLFINTVADGRNTAIEISPETFTWSKPPLGFKQWWRQKRRHLSTASSYSPLTAFWLGMFGLSQLLFYILLIPMIFFFWQNLYFQIMLFAKFALQGFTLIPAAKKLNQQNTLKLFPLWEFLIVLFLTIIHLQNKLGGRPEKWN